MSTKVYFVGTAPSETTGSDGAATGGHTPATIDQTVQNLRLAVDRAVKQDGSTPFTGTVQVSKSTYDIANPVFKSTYSGSDHFRVYMDASWNSVIESIQVVTKTPQLIFKTAGVEAGRFDYSGNLLVGLTSNNKHTLYKNLSADYAAQVINAAASSGGLLISLSTANNDAGCTFLSMADGAATRMKVLGNGNVQNVNNSYGAISDIKLKENIAPASSCWNTFKQYRFVNYNLISDPTQTKLLGLIAQEVEVISPSIVEETPDMIEVEQEDGSVKREPNGEVTKSVKYSIVTLQAEVVLQEAQARIEQLEATLENVLARLAALEG